MSEEQGSSQREIGSNLQNPIQNQPIGWNIDAHHERPPPYNPQHKDDEVITVQPSVGVISSNAPLETRVAANCIPGLEYLAVIDQLIICQQIEILETLTGFETQNKYHIKNSLGQSVFFAAEDSSCCGRYCCGTLRALNVGVFDNIEREVLNFKRPLNCQACCFPCCLQEMEVTSPQTGEVLGIIDQSWSIIRPTLSIKTPDRETILKIRGPLLTCSCCCDDVVFNILTPQSEELIGTITKQWSGCCKEVFSDADNFSICFPAHLKVNVKATLLAAVFLIDYMYYEDSGRQSSSTNMASKLTCIFLKAFLKAL